MAGVLGFAGLGVSGFALISAIVAVALDYWIYSSSSLIIGDENFMGLWKYCTVIQSKKSCDSISDFPNISSTELNVVRAGVILALLLDVGACLCGALKLFMMKEKKMMGYVAAGLLVAAGLFLIIAFGVYVSKIYEPLKVVYDLHAGFAFCIIAWLASWAGAALFGVATMQEQG